jgi:hypothetical protein
MSSNNIHAYIYKSGLLILFGLYSGLAMAQTEDSGGDSTSQGKYAMVVYVGGGFSRFIGTAGKPPGISTSINRNGPVGTLRILWQTDHRLRVGVESGWTTFYSYKLNGGGDVAKVNLYGIPVLMVFSMPLGNHLNLYAGPGTYYLSSDLNYATKVNTHTWSLGFMAAAAYVVPLSEKLSLGMEVKWLNATQTKDAALSGQVMFIWKFYQW